MSSVSGSDSSNPARAQEETIRKNRESHQNAESDMVKKQAKEIRRLNEEHYAEVENLKQDHQAQMNDLRKATGTEITERDHKYNQDVEDLRDLYKKQMTSQSEEAQRREETLRKATSGDLNQSKSQSNQRFQKLSGDFEKGLQAREVTYEDALKQNSQAQKAAIADNRDKLERNYDEQMKSLKDERNMRVGGLQKGFDDYRQSTEAQKRDTDLRHFQDQERSSNSLLRAVQKERLAKQDSEEYLREGFKDGLQQTRERFEKAAAKEREVGNISREQMKATVGDRIDNQVNRLEQENLDLKEGNVRGEVKMRQKMHREVANITDAYQKNMDNFQEQRDEAVRSSNDRVHKDIQKVRKDLDNQAVDTNRYYRSHQEEQNQIHRAAYDNLKGDMEIRNEQQKSVADQRVKNLYETTAEEKSRMSEQIGENHKLSQFAHQDDMKALRANLEADKQIAVNNLQEHIQKQELQHSEKMTQVVGKYEKQIQALKDELMKEKKTNDDNLKRSTEEMQHQHKLSMDQVAMQNRDRLRQMDAHHSDELRSLNKRNDERLDQVLAEVKKT